MVRLCANLKTGTLSCERRDVFSSKKTIPSSTLFNTLFSVHRWLSLFNRKCLSHLPLLHSCSSVDHSHIVPVDVMRSIPFKDMLSDGRFLWMIEPNCIPMFLRSYFQSSFTIVPIFIFVRFSNVSSPFNRFSQILMLIASSTGMLVKRDFTSKPTRISSPESATLSIISTKSFVSFKILPELPTSGRRVLDNHFARSYVAVPHADTTGRSGLDSLCSFSLP